MPLGGVQKLTPFPTNPSSLALPVPSNQPNISHLLPGTELKSVGSPRALDKLFGCRIKFSDPGGFACG